MNEAIILALVFAVLLFAGVPISFAIGSAAVAALLMSLDPASATTVIAQRMATGLDSFALLAIPFFILSGQLMNRGGIARRLIDLAKVVVGRLPGGLAYVNVLGSMLFGSISGSAVAAAAAIGGTMSPLMKREGYDREFSAAVNISAAPIGLLIPPSNIMVVYSLASGGVSIAALFLAGYVPGIVLGLALMMVIAVIAKRRGYPVGEKVGFGAGVRILLAAVPSLLLVGIVMGGIILGWFTPTEASAIAVAARSIWVTGLVKISPALKCAGHEANIGTRTPPSHTSPLLPRYGVLSEPFGELRVIAPPLSLKKHTSVSFSNPASRMAASTSPMASSIEDIIAA
jgi:tripartite ATP-independent transporter DctM subunit